MIKKYISKATLMGAALTALFGIASCTAGFEDANRPGSAASAGELARDNYTIGSFLVQMQNSVFPEQENDFQMDHDLIGNYLARYMTYVNNGWNGANFATMNAPVSWVRYPFKSLTPKFTSAFNEVIRLNKGKEDINYAWALILRAQGYLTMTDIYGPFPIGAVEGDPTAYSSQQEVYTHIIADLDKALSILSQLVTSPSYTANQTFDKVYGGKFAKWMKFANSLKLRMAIRMSGIDPTTAQRVGEEAVAAGVIEENEDNLVISYTPHGLYKTSVEWGDSRACADLESFMNGYNDPRISRYFKEVEERPAGFRAIIGCRAGAKIGNKSVADPIYSAANVVSTTKGVWLTAAEMWFCRAEGRLIGWQNMGGNSVEDLYNMAITTSFKQWEAGDASSYLNNSWSMQADYQDAQDGFGHSATRMSTITVKWDDYATIEEKMERLITQKWIALFPYGQEGWNELRRTGYPRVFAVDQTTAYSIKVPNRIPFADTEMTENPVNLQKARQMLGGADDYATKMWWQKKWWQ